MSADQLLGILTVLLMNPIADIVNGSTAVCSISFLLCNLSIFCIDDHLSIHSSRIDDQGDGSNGKEI